jgi:hypothetical protein
MINHILHYESADGGNYHNEACKRMDCTSTISMSGGYIHQTIQAIYSPLGTFNDLLKLLGTLSHKSRSLLSAAYLSPLVKRKAAKLK